MNQYLKKRSAKISPRKDVLANRRNKRKPLRIVKKGKQLRKKGLKSTTTTKQPLNISIINKERNLMTEIELVSAVVAAINADIAAGNGNFVVALSPDSTSVVLSSTPLTSAPKTESFPVTNPTQAA
jgi:hypothetical protein